jgi:hypothetical protein
VKDEFDNSQLKTWSDLHNTDEQSHHDNQIAEYLEGHQIDHVFYDPIATYMEEFFSWNTWPCFHYKDQICYQWSFPLHYSVLILFKYDKNLYYWITA